MSKADVCAAILWVGATLYAVFGGADFGAGFWSLVGGKSERGDRARRLIDSAIGPVWEANHVWLIFILVVLWTAFSVAFEAVMSTLFIPLCLVALGIRPARWSAFHEVVSLASAASPASVRGLFRDHPVLHGHRGRAIASGRVAGNATGDPWSSWPIGSDPGRGPFRRYRAYLAGVF